MKKIEGKIEYSTNFGNFIYLTYLYSCVFYEVQNYEEFLEYAIQMLNLCDQNEEQKIKNINYVLHTYQMIINALLNHYKQPKQSIEYLKNAIELSE